LTDIVIKLNWRLIFKLPDNVALDYLSARNETTSDCLRQSRWRLATTLIGDKLTLK
jgi:hypothetical protein